MRGRVRPLTLQAENVHRAAREIAEKGGYFRVADIRARIRVARSAVELGDLSELERLSEALVWLKGNHIRTAMDLAAKAITSPDMAAYVQRLGILKDRRSEQHHALKPSKSFFRAQGASVQRSNAIEHASEHQHTRQRDEGRESQR